MKLTIEQLNRIRMSVLVLRVAAVIVAIFAIAFTIYSIIPETMSTKTVVGLVVSASISTICKDIAYSIERHYFR
jgi:NhaP-type Na+/H+ or K+/H+ antiporter